eukprot:755694-Hanusia_phi.AAC.3
MVKGPTGYVFQNVMPMPHLLPAGPSDLLSVTVLYSLLPPADLWLVDPTDRGELGTCGSGLEGGCDINFAMESCPSTLGVRGRGGGM